MSEYCKWMFKDKQGNDIDMWKFAEYTDDPEYKKVCQEHFKDLFVSTVWLGVVHNNNSFFETMVFVGQNVTTCGSPLLCVRYATLSQAEEGHKNVVKLLQLGFEKFPNDQEKVIKYVEDAIDGTK